MGNDLGRSIAVHRGTFGAGGYLWYIGGILAVAGVVSLLRVPSPPPGQTAVEAALTGVAGIFAGAVPLLIAWNRLRQTVEVFERGFVWTRLIGTRVEPRSDVVKTEIVTVRSRRQSYSKVVVTLTDSRELNLRGLEYPEQLANLLGPVPRSLANYAAPDGNAVAPGSWRPPGT